MSEPFIAEVRMFTCDFAPRGWSFCNGQLVPISQNTALFSLIGQTYGGDGRTTCALPNLTDRVPMHPGQGPGLTRRNLGEQLGTETVTLTEEQLPAHNHSLFGVDEKGDSERPSNDCFMSQEGGNRQERTYYLSDSATTDTELSPATLGSSGGNLPHNNMQPFLGVNFCIAMEGTYPSRS
ncbi:phage tail protein [Colwellia sp. RSH04]|uniref:phage tail protein n=1 Tax=Colwellia sp. RSH04 TaxID=2305464 RepID=UPI000E589E8A|nr:tail fiber protein [Colwellia sp. RSH04]RHW77999.1 phage tail protein [Colwellia sp. RSH04]